MSERTSARDLLTSIISAAALLQEREDLEDHWTDLNEIDDLIWLVADSEPESKS